MADTILESLNDPLVLLFFKFLEWVLPKFTNMNKLFQSEKSEIAIVHSKMEEIYKGIYYSKFNNFLQYTHSYTYINIYELKYQNYIRIIIFIY